MKTCTLKSQVLFRLKAICIYITISYFSQLLCKGVQKLLGEWFFETALLSKSKCAAMCEMCGC